jgi:hypothetical protein
MWKHCSKVIHRPGVCYCAVLSVVRKMSEAKVHVSMEQRIIIKFLTKEGCKISVQLRRGSVVRRHCQMIVSISGALCLKKGRKMVENEPHER